MRKFKILPILLVVILSLSFVGCAKPVVETTSMEIAQTEIVDINALVDTYFANLPENNYKIGQADFVDMVKAGEEMFVLDIRSVEDYEKGHIAGAVNAPWGTAISDNLKYVSQDKPVFVYCYTGQTAGQAVVTLNLAGLDARSVNLGWNMGISKVEGVDSVIVTEASAFGTEAVEIAPEIQTALDAYYTGLAEVKDTKFANYKVSEDNLKAMIEAKDDFYLLSVRGAEDFAKGHIQGANNLPWGKGMEQGFSQLPKDKVIVVYCYTGQTAGQTVAGLRLQGFDAVSLNGGMGSGANAPMGWSNKGFEIVSSNSIETLVKSYFANMPEDSYKISEKDFAEKVVAEDDMFILDIRSKEDYDKGHVIGAYNAPWGVAISDNLKNIPSDKPVYVYCYTGQTAGQAVVTLNLAGFDAKSVNFGWNLGISKLENISSISDTTTNEFTEAVSEIDPLVQSELDKYYSGLADVKGTTFANYKISEDDLKSMVDGNEDFYLLSVRKEADYVAGHIKGANSLPWGKGMEAGFDNLPKDKKVVVYCYTGQTAGQTVAGLRLLGYDAVSLNGGMGKESNAPMGWSNKEFEIVQ